MFPKSEREDDPSQFRPITVLLTLSKILTSCLANRICRHVDEHYISVKEQKGCKVNHSRSKEQQQKNVFVNPTLSFFISYGYIIYIQS